MTKNEIIEELYGTNFVQKYVAEVLVNKEIYEDAVAEVWLIICSISEDRLQRWHEEGGVNKVRQVASGIINRQCRSRSSSLHYQYIRKDVNNIQIQRTSNDRWDEETGWEY